MSNIDNVLVERKCWVERHSEQFDVVSELHVTFCDMDAMWLVDLWQPLDCTENHSFSFSWVQEKCILSVLTKTTASGKLFQI